MMMNGAMEVNNNSANISMDGIIRLESEHLGSSIPLLDIEELTVIFSTLIATFVIILIVCKLWSCLRGRQIQKMTLFIGLPFSGKTALLSRIVSGTRTACTRMSMEPNKVVVSTSQLIGRLPRNVSNLVPRSEELILVDYPGHRRLRDDLFAYLDKAHKLIIVIDSVQIQDDRHCGAAALAELLLSVLQSHAFAHVEYILFVCNKRNEITSYSARAVRQILEKAMARTIQSRGGDLSMVDSVVDTKGGLISANQLSKGARNNIHELKNIRQLLHVDENNSFSFNQLGLPFEFVDVSAFPDADVHDWNVNSVVEFILREGE